MNGIKKAILISEVGWKGMRECAIALSKKGVLCEIIVKGNIPPDVLAIITPYKGITIEPVSRMLFNIRIAAKIFRSLGSGGTTRFIFSKETTAARFKYLLSPAAPPAGVLLETKDGYEISDHLR